MRTPQQPPKYANRPIRSLQSLARALNTSVADLQRIALTASDSYRPAKPILKKDGTYRQPYDAKEPLKTIHRRIKKRFLDKVTFPDYLTGSLKDRSPKSNAKLHIGASIVVCEDISGFFPSTTQLLVFDVWSIFFGFSEDVSKLLSTLCCRNGQLPQGAITSSHLANLVFFKREHKLYSDLQKIGWSYSRYVDDMTISSVHEAERPSLTNVIAKVYGMMSAHGYAPNRTKQEIQRANGPMKVTKLLVNARPALQPMDRKAIRAAVHQLEKNAGDMAPADLKKAMNSASGRVSRLQQLHPAEGEALRSRLRSLRARITKAI